MAVSVLTAPGRPAGASGPAAAARSAAAGLAEQALRRYLSDPAEAQQLAAAAERAARELHDWATASTARRVLGLVAGHVADSSTAQRHLDAAVRLAVRADDRRRAAEARVDLAYVLARQGRTRAALGQLAAARPELRRAEAGTVLMTQALVLRLLGRWDEALEVYQQVAPAVRRGGDRQALAVLVGNRGVVHAMRGALGAAERDLTEAGALLESLGQGLHRAIVWHNLGYVSSLRGDVAEALARFDRAEQGYRAHREVPLELERDRCELLLSAGLAAEARDAAARAVETAGRRHEPAERAEAQVRLAQAALMAGDPVGAVEAADAAARTFTRQRRPGSAALARWTAVLGCLATGTRPVTVEHVLRAAARLEQAGWTGQALEARLRAAQLAAEQGRPLTARRQLDLVRSARRTGTPAARQLGWQAQALRRLHADDPAGARRAAARGLALAEEYRGSVGASDLRAGASVRVEALARLGLRTALEDGRPATVLSWAERLRAAHLLRPPVAAPDDALLARELAELRQVTDQHRKAVESGEGDRAELLRRQAGLERAVRDRARSVRPSDTPRTLVPAGSAALAAALGRRALVEYVTVDGRVHALTLVDGRLRLHPAVDLAPLVRELASVPFALRRLALHPDREPSATAARRVLEHVGQVLDDALLRPLAGALGDRELVVVPTSPLQPVPWSLLPSCRGRAVTVTPSATLWLAAAGRPPAGAGGTLLVAGPRLAHAEPEVAALAAALPAARVLTGPAATAEAVLEGMEGAALVHIAAHCEVRSDNPQFSALGLADGPLTVYDLERLRRPPEVVVLSACESGRSTVLAGDELLGLSAALLSAGVRTLVASVVHVSDADAAQLMTGLHEGVRRGLPVPAALAAAQERAYGGGSSTAAAAAFVCLGLG